MVDQELEGKVLSYRDRMVVTCLRLLDRFSLPVVNVVTRFVLYLPSLDHKDNLLNAKENSQGSDIKVF